MTEEQEIAELKRKIHELEALADPFRVRFREIRRAQFLREIPNAMKGNMVWCRNGLYTSEAARCQNLRCPFKNNEQRLATPGELGRCNTFQITTVSNTWATARHVFPPPPQR